MAEPTIVLLEMVRQLREDYARDQEASRESRAALHRRVDEVIERLAQIETTVAIAGQIDAQVRQELDALKSTVEVNATSIAPTVDEWRRIRAIGIGIVGLLAVGGISIGAAAMWAGEALVNAVRGWLKIP